MAPRSIQRPYSFPSPFTLAFNDISLQNTPRDDPWTFLLSQTRTVHETLVSNSSGVCGATPSSHHFLALDHETRISIYTGRALWTFVRTTALDFYGAKSLSYPQRKINIWRRSMYARIRTIPVPRNSCGRSDDCVYATNFQKLVNPHERKKTRKILWKTCTAILVEMEVEFYEKKIVRFSDKISRSRKIEWNWSNRAKRNNTMLHAITVDRW